MSALRLPALVIAALLLVFGAAQARAQGAERVLFETRGMFSDIVVSEDENGHRILRFGRRGARQSMVRVGDPDFLALSYLRVALSGLALQPEPARILIIGLGGGSLPMVLRKYYPAAVIDVVEIDPAVATVARDYFGFREDSRLRAHIDDGRRFVQASRQPYDVILLDAFGTQNVPPHLTTAEFLYEVKRIVAPGGVVIGNIWNRMANRLYDDMIRTYQDVFDDLYVLPLVEAANVIVLALPQDRALSQQDFRVLVQALAQRKNFRFALGDDALHGFEPAREKSARGSVLTDQNLAPAAR